ncbi:phage encoded DNA polymerase I [Lachnospiraceae bacterium TWA4]|nr:phage encoded DNA polymerase I [Lachnospiraceae bacterium TWA4]
MEKINTLSIDIETYSDVDLQKSGVYRYVQSEAFEILLVGYSINYGKVNVIDLAQGEKIPIEIIRAFTDEQIIKWAFNSQFERICFSEYLRRFYPEEFVGYSIGEDSTHDYLNPVSWKCTMTWSAYLGLPLSLEGVGAVLGLEEQKLKEGKELIRYFCMPCNPTKSNKGRTRNLPIHDKGKWEKFKKYNIRDVEVELSIQSRLKNFPVPEFIWEEFYLDQQINDRGIALDMNVVNYAIGFNERSKEVLYEQIQKLTGLDNPNSVVQMKSWLAKNGIIADSLDKKSVKNLIKTSSSSMIKEVLKIRQQLSKSSVKKYQAMENAVCRDFRARGMFRFYGANRSGRWAGRMIQLQNLPQNHLPDLRQARELVSVGNYEAMEILYDDIPDTLSQLIRTAFVPRKGMKFVVADFSAIEARVLSHLAKEKWRSEVFKKNGDIYCASASAMFGVPVEKHGQNSELRQKGKIAELALGYGGSVSALTSMGALEMGLEEDELQPLVDSWRSANPNIVRFWWEVDRCIKRCIKEHIQTETHGIRFIYQSGMLFIELPSGRRLSYVKPKIGENRFGGESVTYEGIGGTKKWERIESYGPKFVENIVQAISRDILMYAMKTLSYCLICGHVHDELIIECSKDVSLTEICKQMGRTPPWIPGLILRADGYECDFYQKD